jgi:putative membrane protein
MKTFKLCCIAAIALLTFGCQSSDESGKRFDDSSTLDEQAAGAGNGNDKTRPDEYMSKIDDDGDAFMDAAALAGMMEIDLGRIATTQASNQRVKEFASRMIADHTMASSDLKKIANEYGIILPTEYPADVKAHIEGMKKFKGAEFDKKYMDMMVKDHAKTLNLFKSASLRDDVVKDYAAKTLPVLEEHHKMAVEIQAGLK